MELSPDFRNVAKYTPEQLADKAIEYVDWVTKNPIEIEVVLPKGGIQEQKKIRPMTIEGFSVFAGITSQTYRNYREQEPFFGIISRIDDFLHQYNFDRAAIGEFKENLIARKLGLADKQENDVNMSKPIVINNPYDPSKDGK